MTFTDEVNSIIDTHLDPVLDRATILPEQFTDNLKSDIVSAAEAKVNEAKTAVMTQIDALVAGCARRRLGEMVEVGQDGSQRTLQSGLTFGDLATSIQIIEGIVRSFFVLILGQSFSVAQYDLHTFIITLLDCDCWTLPWP